MTKHLLIFGGSGFIGQAICQEAVKQSIPVVSISRSGRPKASSLKTNSLITWVSSDIFTETHWHQYLSNASGVINLIGILREIEEKQLTYQKMIVEANQIIAEQVASYPKLPYVFLSANAGGPLISEEYIEHKRQAESDLTQLANPVIIVRPGLVVGPRRPLSLIEGSGIFLLAHLPVIGNYFRPVYPINIKALAKRVISEILNPRTVCLTPENL